MADRLLIRADANPRMGTGHVMRCLALAQGWKHTGRDVIFACAEITPALEARLRSEGFAVQPLAPKPGSLDDAEQTARTAANAHAAWIVADGYHFDAAYQRAIKSAGLRLLLVDDYGHCDQYCADIVLNQNLSARTEWYARREPHTRLLLGTRYVLLRGQFRAYRDWQREIPAVARKVLVTLGGADPDNVTGKVIQALCDLDVEAKIIVGGSNPHTDKLKAESRKLKAVEVLSDVSNMPEWMAWADVAIAAGGTTSWELAFMGLPGLVLVLADNQREIAMALDREHVSINLGEAGQAAPDTIRSALAQLLQDPARRATMSQRGRQLVDGQGTERVVRLMDIAVRAAGQPLGAGR